MNSRGSGVLLHVSSLPSAYGIGDLGPEARRFVDFLAEAKQKFWQILPLNPTDTGSGNSPYRSSCAFAGNTLLISPERLRDEGWIERSDIEPPPDLPANKVDYDAVTGYKKRLFDKAFERFKRKQRGLADYREFCAEHAWWLDDFALYVALRERFEGGACSDWPVQVRDRHEDALRQMKDTCSERIEREKFLQYLFFRQWASLKEYCSQRNVRIMGDMAIYVAYESSDLWTHPEMFKLDGERRPTFVAGVPPDYFSKTGQLWGDPVYAWDVMKQGGYSWWVRRIEHSLKLHDMVRIDHFRGFSAYWEVPAGEKTAMNGKWVAGPGDDFFHALLKKSPHLPLIAEDLGVITPDVRELMRRFGLPGMKVLLFAFNDDLAKNPYVPHNHVKHCVVYTGTHDNNTARGWFENEADPGIKDRLFTYLGRELAAEEVPWEMLRLAMMSVADMAIVPVQDILGLGSQARMNRPSVALGNWEWRLGSTHSLEAIKGSLREMTEIYGRA